MWGSAEQTLQTSDDYASIIAAFVSQNTASSTNHFINQYWELWYQIEFKTNLKDLEVKNQQIRKIDKKAPC